MYECSFELNNKPMSAFKMAGMSFPAFSGRGDHVNRRFSACHVGVGPIPPSIYYIFDRQSGGVFGAFYDMFSGRDDWFSLYATDGKIDDETYCNNVKRGLFRLHPGSASEGCITIKSMRDYQRLRAMLRGSKPMAVPGSKFLAYGKVVVA